MVVKQLHLISLGRFSPLLQVFTFVTDTYTYIILPKKGCYLNKDKGDSLF